MDEKTLSAIIEEEKDALFVVAFHYCKNRFDAEDAVQNAMLRLLSAKKPFASREHLRRWLIRVTVNECKRLLMSPGGSAWNPWKPAASPSALCSRRSARFSTR